MRAPLAIVLCTAVVGCGGGGTSAGTATGSTDVGNYVGTWAGPDPFAGNATFQFTVTKNGTLTGGQINDGKTNPFLSGYVAADGVFSFTLTYLSQTQGTWTGQFTYNTAPNGGANMTTFCTQDLAGRFIQSTMSVSRVAP